MSLKEIVCWSHKKMYSQEKIFFFLWLNLWHVEVPGPGVKSELQLQQQSHSNTRFLTHWARPGIEPTSSGILVGFLTCWATKGTPWWYSKWHSDWRIQQNHTYLVFKEKGGKKTARHFLNSTGKPLGIYYFQKIMIFINYYSHSKKLFNKQITISK